MALDRLTKIDGGGISTTSDYRVGIITASKFVGPFDGSGGNFSGVVTATNGVFSGNISAVDGNFSGNVTIGGTLTYEDVTNIDSVGLITARNGIDCNGDLDVDGHTNLDNVSIAGVTTMTGALTISSTTDQMLNLNSSDNNGTSLAFQRNGSRQGYIGYGGASAGLIIANEYINGAVAIQGNDGGSYINMLSFATDNKGLATLHGGATIPLDLDVDGHTNLDNVNIAGVTTAAGNIRIANNAPSLIFDDQNHSVDYTLAAEANAFKLTDSSNGDRISFNANSSISVTASMFQISGASDIIGDLSTNGTLTLPDSIIHTGDTDTKIRFPTNDQIQFETAGTSWFNLGSTGAFQFGNNSNAGAKVYIKNGNDDANNTNALALDIQGAWMRIGDAILGNETYSNGIGIKFHNSGTAHHSISAQGQDLYFSLTSSNGNQLWPSSRTDALRLTGAGAAIFAGDITAGGNLYIPDRIYHVGDTNTQIRFPAADTISMETAGSEVLRITSDGELLVGTANKINSSTSKFQVAATDATGSAILSRFNASVYSSYLDFYKSRSNTLGTAYVVNDDDHLGAFRFYGADGSNSGYTTAAEIYGSCDGGSGSSGDMPGRITFHTRPDGAGQSMQERLRIDSGGRLLINTTTEGHGNADDLTIATAASGSLGHTGITIRSGTSSDGNIFFSDATSGGGETIGGIKYKHGGAGSNPETLNFIANGLTRATVGATYFYVDDGTNARLKIQPDSATLNMIVSTTTNNGSYCDLSYQAANHIFKYGGNERGRLSTDGDFTITGELAAAQDYPNFRPTLDLNFAAVKKLDSRITFYRSTVASYIDENGDYRWASMNEPRFNHDETTFESKGLLIEPARTNKLSSGNNIPSGGNSGGNPGPSLVANNVEAPDGSFTARTIDYSNASSNMNSANVEFTWDNTPSGKTYSASIWVKGTAGHTINFYLDASGQGSSDTGKVHTTLTGKWQRLSVYHTYPSGSNAAYLRCGTRNLQTGVEGTATVVSLWGTTVVEESQPGSTIATPIVPVTTAPDYALIDGEDFTNFFNEAEGTIITSTQTLDPTGVRRPAVIEGDVTNNERHYLQEASQYQYQIRDGGSTVAQIDAGQMTSSKNIIAAAYKLNDAAVSFNGSDAATDTSATMPTCTKLKLGEWSGTFYFGHISRFTYYSRRVTNSQLKTLSST